MFGNKSMFGYQSDNPAARRAYDMMVLDQIEKDDKELALEKMYGERAALAEMEEELYGNN